MQNRGRILCLTALVCLLGGNSWGQTYNPTASDPTTGNTAGGTGALPSNSGSANTAFGRDVLGANTTGAFNTASGSQALRDNTTGAFNTASGVFALRANTTGEANTATGAGALLSNTTGRWNTATGINALFSNTIGSSNTASGSQALFSNITGTFNTALGWRAGIALISGSNNTASGAFALQNNTIGVRNTALGTGALRSSATGSRNTALGWGAGASLISGSNNLYLNHQGVTSESRTMRLGSSAQTRAFIAGVVGRPVSGSQVMINSDGQLGVLASSARYKQNIQPMGDQQEKLQQLRPVTFTYKEEPTGTLQYGLIAEEVAKVYPELVIRNADGEIEGVRYEELTPLLLNELQHQQQTLTVQKQELAALKAQNERLQATLAAQQATIAARLERLEAAGIQTTRV